MRSERSSKPQIVLHLGSSTNQDASVSVRVTTNDNFVVTRLYLSNPAVTDLQRLREEIVCAFSRAICKKEIAVEEARLLYRRSDRAFVIEEQRQALRDWKNGKGKLDDEEALRLFRKVLEPGVATKEEVLTFASRLYLYMPQYDLKFPGRNDKLSFAEALEWVSFDPRIRLLAAAKADEVEIFGGGRGKRLSAAAQGYSQFLRELATGEKNVNELKDILEDAEAKLAYALEGAK